jgi:flagellar export protein FliJ
VPRFLFKFAPLLKYRRHQRDLCRQLLAEVMAEDQRLIERRQQVEAARTLQLGEMRELLGVGTVDIDRSAARRFHAGQLVGDMRRLEAERQLVAQQLARCREALVQADQRVKALEKLAEKQAAEFAQDQERRTARDLEESWLAAHAHEVRAQ